MAKPFFDHFGLLAPLYEFFIKPKKPDNLCTLIDCPPEGMLLDAGGGTGRVAQFLSTHANRVIVADESHKMLRQAGSKGTLEPVCSLTESLPFADGFFDRIIMVDALHHVEHQQLTVLELWRVLKPGGKIVIEEPDIHHLAVKLIALGEKLALMRTHFLSPKKIADLFGATNAGITIELDGGIAWIIVKKPFSEQSPKNAA